MGRKSRLIVELSVLSDECAAEFLQVLWALTTEFDAPSTRAAMRHPRELRVQEEALVPDLLTAASRAY